MPQHEPAVPKLGEWDENYKNLHNRAQNITCRSIIETEVKGSRLENPNLSSKHMKQGVNTQKASQSVPEFDKKFSDGRPIMGSSIPPLVH
ncbi:hypothetical protein KP509_1Z152200 [Ceratopteris richardii]|nr:hypothetical protein KP509_1Z152200 [Ceratopteris richardii]